MKVMVVDDHQDNRVLLRAILESQGYAVEEATNGMQALDRARTEPPDLFISDILMPEMDGFTLCRAVKGIEQLRRIPLVFYTATYLEREDEELGLELGAALYIRKPVEPAEFLRLIEQATAKSQNGGLPKRVPGRNAARDLEARHQARLAQKLDKKIRDVDRLRREQALILACAGEGVLGLDLDENHTFANDAAARLLGYSVEELIGRHGHTLWHHTRPDGGPYAESECPIRQAGKDGRSVEQVEDLFWRKDGSSFPVEYAVSPLVEEGCTQGVVVVFRDITERKRTEEALRDSETRFRNLMEKNRTGVLAVDQRGAILYANPVASELFGREGESLVGHPFGVPAVGSNLEMNVARRDGKRGVAEMSATKTEWHGNPAFLVMLQDVTERIQAEERVRHMTTHDALTGVPNRVLFRERLEHALERAKRAGNRVAVLFMDVNRFKAINDSLGHDAGDTLLRLIGERLPHCVRSTDTVARMGGDEFAVLLEEIERVQTAREVARKIQSGFAAPVVLDNKEIFVGLSIGIALYPNDGEDAELLSRHAGSAMYFAKRDPASQISFYRAEMSDQVVGHLQLEHDLRRALKKEQFVLHYQPKVELETGRLVGAEALLRWQRPSGDPVSPEVFIQVMEETGQILEVGQWVLRQACLQVLDWARTGLEPVPVAINVSPRQLADADFAAGVQTVLADTGVDPRYLDLELTETAVMTDVQRSREILRALVALGVRLHLDDFGTGYSSLGMLRRLPFDTVKVDRSFVMDVPDDPEDALLTAAIIAMAHGLHMQVVAEGVETDEQLVFLRRNGCDFAQGWLFGHPVPGEEIAGQLMLSDQGQRFVLPGLQA